MGRGLTAQRLVPRTLLALAALALAGVLLALWSGPADAQETTFTVNRTGDENDLDFPDGVFDGTSDGTCDTSSTSGMQCTLRAAIQEANENDNAPAVDTINFNITSGTTSVKTINVVNENRPGNVALPEITDAVTINGYTQQGAEENTLEQGNNAELKIQLDGSDTAGPAASGLEIFQASNSTIKGLVINRFDDHGVIIRGSGATGNKVEGNFIGTNVAGTDDRGNDDNGVIIAFGSNNTIGGTEPGTRNVISGNGNDNGGVAIQASGAEGNKVMGNFIGTTADGTEDLGNGGVNGGNGVVITSVSGNTIGGTEPGAGNVISGNTANGVLISGTEAEDNKVEGNRIGTKADGTGDLGNDEHGVQIHRAPLNTIGGTASGAGNRISGNGDDGIAISQGNFNSAAEDNKVEGNVISRNSNDGVAISGGAKDNTIGTTSKDARNHITANGDDGVEISGSGATTGNSVLVNSIYSNTGLGIDLGASGVTANDNKDLDTGANNLQNFPVITSAIRSNTTGLTTISGTIHSNTNQTFTIRCFVAVQDESRHGEARSFVGEDTTVTTDFNGNASFSCSPPSSIRAGLRVTATATNTATGDTSEFSRNVLVVSGP